MKPVKPNEFQMNLNANQIIQLEFIFLPSLFSLLPLVNETTRISHTILQIKSKIWSTLFNFAIQFIR